MCIIPYVSVDPLFVSIRTKWATKDKILFPNRDWVTSGQICELLQSKLDVDSVSSDARKTPKTMTHLFSHVVLLSCMILLVNAFQLPTIGRRNWKASVKIRQSPMLAALEAGSFLPSWLQERLDKGTQKKISQKQQESQQESASSAFTTATVVRLAARQYNKDSSKPSSREYTTRKNSRETITVNANGVEDDYNHYRTVALKSTPDRAISLLTRDVMTALQSSFSSDCTDGDLGENVLLDGIAYNDIQVGQQYTFGTLNNSAVTIQVTEPMIPCANLCKLSYINDANLVPKERIQKCQALLEFLDKPGDGFRGWYAKVITPGVISVGDEFRVLMPPSEGEK